MATILDATEAAVVAYLTDQHLAAPVVPGIRTGDKPNPSIICTARKWALGEEGANGDVELIIEVRSSDADQFKSLCDSLQAAIWLEDAETLGAQLTQASPDSLTVYGARPSPNVEREVEDDMFFERHMLELHVSAA